MAGKSRMQETMVSLKQDHTPEAVRRRLALPTRHNYLGDMVFGAIDGVVTTFAVVSGAAGAELSSGVAVILGFANLFADGLSMAAGNFLSTRSEVEMLAKVRRTEERQIEVIPDGEREEIRQIFAAKGLEGEILEEVVRVITHDRQRWVDTMVTEEYGLQLYPPSPCKAAGATFGAFLLAGLVPILPFLLPIAWISRHSFLVSAIATGWTFVLIGWLKGRFVERSSARSALETLLVGGLAAGAAYLVGVVLKDFGG